MSETTKAATNKICKECRPISTPQDVKDWYYDIGDVELCPRHAAMEERLRECEALLKRINADPYILPADLDREVREYFRRKW